MLVIPIKTELNTYCPACIHVSIEYPFYTTLLRLLFFSENSHSGFVWNPYFVVLTLFSR